MKSTSPKNTMAWGIYNRKTGKLVCVTTNRVVARNSRDEDEKIVRVHVKPMGK